MTTSSEEWRNCRRNLWLFPHIYFYALLFALSLHSSYIHMENLSFLESVAAVWRCGGGAALSCRSSHWSICFGDIVIDILIRIIHSPYVTHAFFQQCQTRSIFWPRINVCGRVVVWHFACNNALLTQNSLIRWTVDYWLIDDVYSLIDVLTGASLHVFVDIGSKVVKLCTLCDRAGTSCRVG